MLRTRPLRNVPLAGWLVTAGIPRVTASTVPLGTIARTMQTPNLVSRQPDREYPILVPICLPRLEPM